MQYTARGRKLTYSRKAIVMFVLPLLAWQALVILNYGLSYKFAGDTLPRLDSVNGGSRVQAYSKLNYCHKLMHQPHIFGGLATAPPAR